MPKAPTSRKIPPKCARKLRFSHPSTKHDLVRHFTNPYGENYSIRIHHNPDQLGLGDGLNTLMSTYTIGKVFGKPHLYTPYGPQEDTRPQKIISSLSNHNNLIPVIMDDDFSQMCECTEGSILRRNLSLQRFHQKVVFNYVARQLKEDLWVDLLLPHPAIFNLPNESLFCILPEEIMKIIMSYLQRLDLFPLS